MKVTIFIDNCMECPFFEYDIADGPYCNNNNRVIEISGNDKNTTLNFVQNHIDPNCPEREKQDE